MIPDELKAVILSFLRAQELLKIIKGDKNLSCIIEKYSKLFDHIRVYMKKPNTNFITLNKNPCTDISDACLWSLIDTDTIEYNRQKFTETAVKIRDLLYEYADADYQSSSDEDEDLENENEDLENENENEDLENEDLENENENEDFEDLNRAKYERMRQKNQDQYNREIQQYEKNNPTYPLRRRIFSLLTD